MEIKNAIRLSCLISLTYITSTSYASGFRVPEISTLGVGTSNALVANTTEAGALPYNPAGMSFQADNLVSTGLVYVSYDLNVTPASGTATDTTGKDTFYIPNFFFMVKDKGPWSFGLAINSPFGLETRWPDETFASFAGALDPAEPETSRIQMVNFNPNIAYKFDENTSIAVGLDYYEIRDLVFNTQSTKIEGRGNNVGWNIAFQKKLGELNLGVSFRSRVNVELDGTLTTSTASTAVEASVEFPDMLQAGVQYQINNQLGVEFDVEHTGWSTFDVIRIKSPLGSTLTTSINNWEDAWAYRLGLIYKLTDATKLLFGYSMDETGQPDSFFSARIPDNDRQLLSIGVQHNWDSWTIEAAYMYVTVDDRVVNSSTTQTGADANGTSSYNGTYQSSVNLLGIGITKKF